jgi:hypothetical protein
MTMGKVGGERNFGYGKQMAWAGKNALADRYGDGHYGTQAAHGDRWQQFCDYARDQEVRDVRQVTEELVTAYGESLQQQVEAGEMAVSYAQNLISSVNVVLETMRGDTALRVSPSELVGERNNVRQDAPAGMERERLQQATAELREKGEDRVAVVAELARELGLRFREASLLDARTALNQATEKGAVNITEGTKGGRGHIVDRWVPVWPVATEVLERAAELQGHARNLIPEENSYTQWRDHAYHAWSQASRDNDLKGFHDLRAAYACERYEQLTGHPAPVISGERLVDKEIDLIARETISSELGHGRVDVVSAYVGSGR